MHHSLYSVHYLAICWFPSYLVLKADPLTPKYIQKKQSCFTQKDRVPTHRSFGRELFSENAQEKFEAAVTFESDATETLLTLMVPPDALVTRTSTVLVPNPLEFSKKL